MTVTLIRVTLFVLEALDGGFGGVSAVVDGSIAAKSANASLEPSGDFQGKRPRTMEQ